MSDKEENLKSGWNLDNSYSKLPEIFYTRQNASIVPNPELIILNNPVAEFLGIDVKQLQSKEGVAILSGNHLPEGSSPIAQAYAGHQFGYFTMLGDGRALLLGEQITPQGDRFDIQLKGSGITPYSRGGDGKAALGPMLREYIISEAMYGLQIPTTRSLAVVKTGETVYRELHLPGAILTRIAASHIRVGTFEFVSKWAGQEDLKTLADYTIQRHYSYINQEDENKYLTLLKEIIKRQAELIAKWQMVGFIHGVMNTDNMVISGETIDYGPCAFMDSYDPDTVFSSIDKHGRYAYGNQPSMGAWDLARLAEAILPLLDNNEDKAVQLAGDAITEFSEIFHQNWMVGMRKKLGLFEQDSTDLSLIQELLSIMVKYRADYTNTFRALTLEKFTDSLMLQSEEFDKWKDKWEARRSKQGESKQASQQLMKENNPAVIPRNHRVEEALEAAVTQGDYEVMNRLLHVLSNPFAYTPEQEEFTQVPEGCNGNYRTFCGT